VDGKENKTGCLRNAILRITGCKIQNKPDSVEDLSALITKKRFSRRNNIKKNKMNTMYQHHWRKRWFLFIPIFLIGLFAVSAIVMLLWNAILPKVSGLLPLSYWQAMGLFILSRILFSGFHFRRHHGNRPPFIHPSIKNRFMEMNDEEREQFRSQWKQRFCK